MHKLQRSLGIRTLSVIAAVVAAATLSVACRPLPGGGSPPTAPKPTIVLVHGAWADGSSWTPVAEQLKGKGYDVRVPPNNLRGPINDSTDLRNYLNTIPGPIVLVGHSYAGFVITNAAVGVPQVKALVYVDAFLPAEGETLLGLTHPPSVFAADPATFLDLVPYVGAPEGAVDTYVKTSVFRNAFASRGLSSRQMEILAATQRPLSTNAFFEPSGVPAWASIPSWVVVGAADQIIPAADQTSMAQRAGATVVTINEPHLAMLTNPGAVTKVIVSAATSR